MLKDSQRSVESDDMIQEKQGQIQQLIEKIILNPSQKVYCISCKRDINCAPKIIDPSNSYYCCSCFSNLHPPPHHYRVINQLNYPLFDQNWTAQEELLLFEGIYKNGFGNWAQIAEHIKTKDREEVQDHYLKKYLNNNNFLPSQDLLTKRNSQGVLVYKIPPQKIVKPQILANKTIANINSISTKRASTGNKLTSKIGKNPTEIIGYLPKRGDFQTQYDNDAQFLLAEMQFNDQDDPSQRQMKFRLIDIYNHKLNQRIIRKQFVISRKLLDSRQQIRLDKTRTKEQKEIYNMMKVFARFNSYEEHQKLVQSIIKQKQIRQRIEELKQLKKKGIKTFGQVQDQLDNKKKKDDKGKKRQTQYTDKTRRVRKDNLQEKTQKKVTYINKEEQQLCRKLNMTFKQFVSMKERILKQSVRVGFLKIEDILSLFEQDRAIVVAVFDFLLKHQDIMLSQQIQIGIS